MTPDELRVYNREWRARYRAEHPEKERATRRTFYLRHRERLKAKSREYGQTHRQQKAVSDRAYRARNLERIKTRLRASVDARRARRRLYSHQIGTAAYRLLLVAQDGRCAICKVELVDAIGRKNGRSPHIDHNHETGEIRGLLCGFCNLGIAHFKESIESLAAASVYLSDPPARAVDLLLPR